MEQPKQRADLGTPVSMDKRDSIKIQRAEGNRNRMTDASSLVLWFDSRALPSGPEGDALLARLPVLRYTGVVLYRSNFEHYARLMASRLQKVLHLTSQEELAACLEGGLSSPDGASRVIISSADPAVLDRARAAGFATCLRCYVDDAASLQSGIALGRGHQYVMISFRDPTNIPLELVIATLQPTQTILIKEITDPEDIDDAIVSLGVMEVGSDGVMFSPRSLQTLQLLSSRLDAGESPSVAIQVGVVRATRPVGMGYRSCVDLATLFSPTEGLLVGSTSQGGVLCCAEVFFLPYMELRPFRVNAGAVHSYVYTFNDRTDYMTELCAGSSVMVVDKTGKTRRACVGRMKTELRPLRLIDVEFSQGEQVNILMQDDWHVRIFSHEGLPLNITTLKPGDKVLGHVSQPGRHVGIKVDEHIIER